MVAVIRKTVLPCLVGAAVAVALMGGVWAAVRGPAIALLSAQQIDVIAHPDVSGFVLTACPSTGKPGFYYLHESPKQ